MNPVCGSRQFQQLTQYAQNELPGEEFLVQVNRLHASELIPLSDSRVLFLLRSIGSSTQLPSKEEFFFKHNALTNQIIFHGRFSKNDEVKSACSALERDYLALPDVAKIKAIAKDIRYYLEGPPLLLVSPHAGVALIVSEAYFRRFALADESWNVKPRWNDVVVVKEERILENREVRLHELFEEFPVFRTKFTDQNKGQVKFASVLKLLDFGDDERHFIDALSCPTYGYDGKLRKNKAPAASVSFFCQKECLEGLTIISEKHCDEILKIYCTDKLPLENKIRENQTKANIFLYLSVVFMKYSSGHYFNTTKILPRTTPDFLRVYALGLFNKAVEFHDNCNCSPIPKNKVPDIRWTLAGYVEICLGELADDLMRYSTNRVEDIYTSIIPPAWQA